MIILLLYLEKGLITSLCLARCLHHTADVWCSPSRGMPVCFRPSGAVPPAGGDSPVPYVLRSPVLAATRGLVAKGSFAPSQQWCIPLFVGIGRFIIPGNRRCWGDLSWLKCVPRECRSCQSARPISVQGLFLSSQSSWVVSLVWR